MIFCLSLLLGCVLCCRNSQTRPIKDHVATDSALSDPVTFTRAPPTPPSAATIGSRQQYEELDGDVLDYPSTFASPAPSERDSSSPTVSRGAPGTSERKEQQPRSYFSLRRLSTPPLTSPLYKPIDPVRVSLPTFPRLGLLSKTCRALQRRCTVTGDSISYSEHSRLTTCPFVPEEPIPLAPLGYGSSVSCQQPISPKPCLHFTVAFSPEEQSLSVTILSLTGAPHRLEDVSVLGSLPPLYPCPITTLSRSGRGLDSASSPMLLLKVGSVEELQKCVLRIAVYTKKPPSLRGTALGEVEVECSRRDWGAEHLFYLSEELNPNKWMLKKVAPLLHLPESCHCIEDNVVFFLLLFLF